MLFQKMLNVKKAIFSQIYSNAKNILSKFVDKMRKENQENADEKCVIVSHHKLNNLPTVTVHQIQILLRVERVNNSVY